jgi:phospholipid/cholesterol/gamma-HCH transport system ATP-binding protein
MPPKKPVAAKTVRPTLRKNKIEVLGMHKAFGSKKVLKGVDVVVEEGQSLVVIGGSGSGKSVLIKNIIGLMEPESGVIKIDGQDTTHLSERERNSVMHKFGYLFQGGALFDSLKIWENIAFGLIQGQGMDRKEAKQIALTTLQSVGMDKEVGELYPSELSGGMQKRVSLARAIATRPQIIFFDEPTTGLDPIMADVINELIVKCSKELGATTITITHDMSSVRKIADKVAMLYEGRIIWEGTKQQMEKSGNPYVEQFIHGRSVGPIEIKLQDH